MQDEHGGGKICGETEVDETFIGGKARDVHKERKRCAQTEGQNTGKTIVLGILERGKTVRAAVVGDRTKASIQPVVKQITATFGARP